MPKITVDQFKKIMKYDVISSHTCIEINFCIDDDVEYASYWTGKLPSREEAPRDVYWYGLVSDGSQAFSFNSLEELLNATVFRGCCIIDLWERVTIDTIDNLNVEYRLPYYL